MDAHGSIINLDAWDLRRHNANPVVLFAHNSQDLPIGRAKKIWKEDGRLMARTEFAGLAQSHPHAETAYQMVRDGFIRAWSVGFMPKERKPRTDISDREKELLPDPYVYTKVELMEYSLVPIPSNPQALLGARGLVPRPGFTSWYQRSADVYRQKCGSSGDEEMIRQYLEARVDLAVGRALLAEKKRIQAQITDGQEEYVYYLLGRMLDI